MLFQLYIPENDNNDERWSQLVFTVANIMDDGICLFCGTIVDFRRMLLS